MAQCPTVPFQLQSVKTETRKQISWRKKHPIAELLMRALNEQNAGPSTPLWNQDSKAFSQVGSVAPPSTVAVNLCLGSMVEITLIECMAYFPNIFTERPLLVRSVRAGLNCGSIANMVNMVRQLSGMDAFTHSRIATLLRRVKGGPVMEDNVKNVETTDFTAREWLKHKVGKTGLDYPLVALEHGLLGLPQGDDAGPLTQLIQLCKTHGKYRVMLSEVPDLLQQAGIASIIQKPVNGDCPDRAAVARHRYSVEQDRARVLTTRGPG
jgi:hypothetical protein